jgi:MFS family permease
MLMQQRWPRAWHRRPGATRHSRISWGRFSQTPSVKPNAFSGSIESRQSWLVAAAVLVILTFSYGAPLVTTIALKDIANDLGSPRSVPALAASLVWLGSGIGAIGFGLVAEKVGFRWIVAFGAIAIGAGLAVSAVGGPDQLVIGHLLLIGLLGAGAINIPLMVYISRWFDRRRGSALALVTSGQYLAGALWPALITMGIQSLGWRSTMLVIGAITTIAILPVAVFALVRPPKGRVEAADWISIQKHASISGMPRALVFALLCLAGFLCCVPMAMPSAHLVALCGDWGIATSKGALMLSVLLGSAFLSRQFWGWLADRVGGLWTVLAGSSRQALALAGFVLTQDEIGLFTIAAAFGLGFSGIIPAYVVALRELYPAHEASWRVPVWFFVNLCGMAFGGWFAGYIYDQQFSYAPAFLSGVAFNVANIAVIGWLISRQTRC